MPPTGRREKPKKVGASSSKTGWGCFYIIGAILWFITLIFGPFQIGDAITNKNAANVPFKGYVVTKGTDSGDGKTFYVLDIAAAPGGVATDSASVSLQAYNATQVGYYMEGVFENDDHLLNATIKDKPDGIVYVTVSNTSTEESKSETSTVVTIIFAILTVVLLGMWLFQFFTTDRSKGGKTPTGRSVQEGSLIIGGAAGQNAFPPPANPNTFPPPPPPNSGNWPPPR